MPAPVVPLALLIALTLLGSGTIARAQPLSYNGNLAAVEQDDGGLFSGTSVGAPFRIRIGNLNADGSFATGSIASGGTEASFACPGPTVLDLEGDEVCGLAAGPSFSDDEALDAETADLLNDVFGGGTFSPGQPVDLVNVEGDAATAGGGRIEVGFTFLFDPGSFSGTRFGTMSPPFDPSLASHVVFFVVEEDDTDDIYAALGDARAVAIPLPGWVAPVAVAALLLASLAAFARAHGRPSETPTRSR